MFQRLNVNLWRLMKPHPLIGIEVVLLCNAIGIRDLAVHRMAQSPDDTALHEVLKVVGVHDPAHFGGNPFDLQTYNYLEGVQLTNFGTVDNPTVVFTADAPFAL